MAINRPNRNLFLKSVAPDIDAEIPGAHRNADERQFRRVASFLPARGNSARSLL